MSDENTNEQEAPVGTDAPAEEASTEETSTEDSPADTKPSEEDNEGGQPTEKPVEKKQGWVGGHTMTGVPKEGVPPSFTS